MYIYAFIYPQFSVESTGISLWIIRGVFSCVDSPFSIHNRLWTTFPAPLAADMRTGSLAARWFPLRNGYGGAQHVSW